MKKSACLENQFVCVNMQLQSLQTIVNKSKNGATRGAKFYVSFFFGGGGNLNLNNNWITEREKFLMQYNMISGKTLLM